MAVMTLRPNAVGDLSQLVPVPGTGEANWEDVDEAIPDEDTTYVYTIGIAQKDWYNLPASGGAGVINSVKVYARIKSQRASDTFAIGVKTGGVEDHGPFSGSTVNYVDYSVTWVQNPDTVAAWTWADIDALQIGMVGSRPWIAEYVRFTQIYVEIDYTPPPGWTGEISGVTDPQAIQGVDKANIQSVKGVA